MSDAVERGLDWWATLSREDKARWLQCAATPDEIDADLESPDPDIRAAAGIAAVGDAWIAFRRQGLKDAKEAKARVDKELARRRAPGAGAS